MSTVVVFGATGYAGSAVTAEAADRGHQVVAVARDVSAVARRPEVRAVAGSLYDPATVAETTADATVIVVAIPAVPQDDPDGPRLADALPALLKAAEAAGARLGFVGGAGSLRVGPDGPLVVELPEFPAAFRDEALSHKAVLDALRSTDTPVDWFYLSPAGGFGSYAPGERTGVFRLGDDVLLIDADGRSYVSAPDLAVAIVDEIDAPAHHRARFTIAY